MPTPKYAGPMTHENISNIFKDAADFFFRQLQCSGHTLYAYAIDGLIAGGLGTLVRLLGHFFFPSTSDGSAVSAAGAARPEQL